MYFKYLIALVLSIYVVNLPDLFYDDAIYQINKLSYSYTNGYGVNQNVSYKIDCEDEIRTVTKEEGEELAKSAGLPIFEASAKDSINVNESFQFLIERIDENITNINEQITTKLNNNKQNNKKGCC